MFKKIALLSIVCFTWMQYAADVTPWLEIKPSYFFFSASPMHDIYRHGAFQIQASTSIPWCHYLDFYASVGYRKAHGSALNGDQITSLSVVPLDIGLKPIFTFDERLSYFFAFGPRFFYFSQSNDVLSDTSLIHDGGIGLFVNTGLNIELAECILLGIFGEYSYEKKTILPTLPNLYSNGPVQIGGFALGVSLGYAF